jgi:hypothetical protein
MALDTQLTQIQSVGISSNTVLIGVTTVTSLNATNAVVTGILTASLIGNVTGNVTGNLTGNVTGNTTGTHIGNVTATTITSSDTITLTTKPFFRTIPTISADYTVTTNANEMSIGPITINNGITVTVNTDATWVVI